VHHLGDSQAAERCVVASSTDHLSAADVDVSLPDGIVTSSVGAVVPALPAIVSTVTFAPTAGRAPPA
jgi:hypothetical protein